jgi:ATP phosphoribosyltransferase regulatory subunit
LLNRAGVTRLCYAGPVLHTRPDRPQATREPLQFGAEIYGHAGREADLEALLLALDCLKVAQVSDVSVDMSDARIVRYLLSEASIQTVLPASQLSQIHAALAEKDASELAVLTKNLPKVARESLIALVQLYGDEKVLIEAKKSLQTTNILLEVLSNLKWLASQLVDTKVTFDLAELSGYAYYSGARFAMYAKNASDALARGGRYDEVGAVFGRNRPAVGFSLDIKELVSTVPPRPLKAAIRAPWGESAGLRAAIIRLRQSGETVVCVLPGHESEVDEFDCDRELVEVAGQWVIKSI